MTDFEWLREALAEPSRNFAVKQVQECLRRFDALPPEDRMEFLELLNGPEGAEFRAVMDDIDRLRGLFKPPDDELDELPQ